MNVECPICRHPIESEQAKFGFRPFVANEADPLYIFNDVAVHATCLQVHPLGAKAQERYQATLQANQYANRVCHVCGDQISSPDDYFGLGHLTDDQSDVMYEFNFKHFHLKCLPRWQALESLLSKASERLANGTWRGTSMRRIEETLRQAAET